MPKNNICENCINWIGIKGKEGFCLCIPFENNGSPVYTNKEKCADFVLDKTTLEAEESVKKQLFETVPEEKETADTVKTLKRKEGNNAGKLF